MLNPIHLLFDGLMQHCVVDNERNKPRFRHSPKGFERPIQRVLLRVRGEPAKQIQGRHCAQLDGGDQAWLKPNKSTKWEIAMYGGTAAVNPRLANFCVTFDTSVGS